MKTTVLITAIGSFSADIAIKTAKQMDMRVVGCDIHDKELIVDAYNVDAFYKCPLSYDEPAYLEKLVEIIKKERITLLLPSTDPEVDVLNKHRKLLEDLGTILCISQESTINICRDKYKLYECLNKNGINEVIPTTLFSDFDVEKVSFPIVCKPKDGRSSQGLHYIFSREELDNLNFDDSYIIQPKIEGSIVTVDVVRHPTTKETVAIPRKELIRTLNGAGTSVYVFHDLYLEDLSRKIAEILDVSGCVNFEYILDKEGKYHFIECNPRFSGGIAFSCMSGYQCVKNHFNCFLNDSIDKNINYSNVYIARKYEEYITKIE